MLKNISFTYHELEKAGDLDDADRELLESAMEAARHAYAPYSRFKVGAAVRLAGGGIVIGSNVENAAFPSGICAERNALSTASATHPGDAPTAIAIAAFSGTEMTDIPVSPCGNCRQVIAEEEYRNLRPVRLILGGKKKIYLIDKVADLLPLQFSRDALNISFH